MQDFLSPEGQVLCSGIMSGAVVLKELFETELFGNNLEELPSVVVSY